MTYIDKGLHHQNGGFSNPPATGKTFEEIAKKGVGGVMTNNLVTDDTRYFVADSGFDVISLFDGISLKEVSTSECMTKGSATYFAARTEKNRWWGGEGISAGDFISEFTASLERLYMVDGHLMREGRFVGIINLGVPYTKDMEPGIKVIEAIDDILETAWKRAWPLTLPVKVMTISDPMRTPYRGKRMGVSSQWLRNKTSRYGAIGYRSHWKDQPRFLKRVKKENQVVRIHRYFFHTRVLLTFRNSFTDWKSVSILVYLPFSECCEWVSKVFRKLMRIGCLYIFILS